MLHRFAPVVFALAACGSPEPEPVKPGECPLEHVTLQQVACVSTTSTLLPSTTTTGAYGTPWDVATSAEVVAAPATRVDVPEAAGMPACDGQDVPTSQTVELLDPEGETWVVGWDFEGDDDVAAVVAGLAPGQAVTLAAAYDFWGYGTNFGLALHDADGPLVLLDRGGLDAATRGFEVQITSDVCVSLDPDGVTTWSEQEVAMSTPVDDLVLFSGQRGTLDHPGGVLEVAVGNAAWMEGCADGCGYTGFAAWAASP